MFLLEPFPGSSPANSQEGLTQLVAIQHILGSHHLKHRSWSYCPQLSLTLLPNHRLGMERTCPRSHS